MPNILSADLTKNPWASRFGLTQYRIGGVITSTAEDAEGNQFRPEQMRWDPLLATGYLDIDHSYFLNHLEEGIIGVPEQVTIFPDHVEATFRLLNRPDSSAIYAYVQDHPNLLGYSVAGPLQKDLLDKGGVWPGMESVALTHAPINAETNSYSVLSHSFFLQALRTWDAVVHDPTPKSLGMWRHLFLSQGWSPTQAHALGLWAQSTFTAHQSMQATPVIREKLLENLLVPPEALQTITDRIAAHLQQYRVTHPQDPHWGDDGRFDSPEAAVAHFRYCEGLTKEQIAHILGVIRNNPAFIVRAPGTKFQTAS